MNSAQEAVHYPDIVFRVANSPNEFVDARSLFEEYAASLDFDLGFQNFREELKTIDQQYQTPKGALILAYGNGAAVGCVGIRPLEQNIAELKRLYVQPLFRQYKIGITLLQQAISLARTMEYRYIRLDSVASQVKAQSLYRSLGFYEIPPYRFNPMDGTVYMEKAL